MPRIVTTRPFNEIWVIAAHLDVVLGKSDLRRDQDQVQFRGVPIVGEGRLQELLLLRGRLGEAGGGGQLGLNVSAAHRHIA